MVISKIIGGLGNQMFQYAFARSLSIQYQKELILFTNQYQNQQGLTKRAFQLDLFKNVKFKEVKTTEELPGRWATVLTDTFEYSRIEKLVKNLDNQSVIYLDGYWQSQKYFQKHRADIFLDFSSTEEENKKLKHLIEPGSTSIHVRRTDYVSSNGYHPVQPISYFNLAIDMIGQYNKLYVFSDDISWCRVNLNYPRMIFMEGRTGIEDMRLMSFCDNNIISNSSFSWWGAWLNQNVNKTVIAPALWFGKISNLNTTDIIPIEWKTIQ
jgi:hypothetical protein